MLKVRTRLAKIATAGLIAGLGVAGLTAGSAQATGAPGAQVVKGVPKPAIVPGIWHPIRNVSSAKCLQPDGTTPSPGVEQAQCDGSAAQNFQFVAKSGNHDIFINQSDAMCLYADGPLANTTPIKLDNCNDSNAEWNASTAVNRTTQMQFTLSSREHFQDSNFCLDVPNARSDVVHVQLFTCNGTGAQQWLYPGEF